MKILAIIAMIVSMVMAEVEFANSGSMSVIQMFKNRETASIGEKSGSATKVYGIFNSNIKVNDRISFAVAPEIFYMSSVYNEIVENKIYEYSNIGFNTLNMTVMVDDDLGLTVGVIPFSNGTFYEYSYGSETVMGNGISTLIDHDMQGAMLTKNLDGVIISAGWLGLDQFVDLDSNNPNLNSIDGIDRSCKGSHGGFLLAKTTIGNNYIEFNYFDAGIHMNDTHVMDVKLAGVAYSYNDLSNSGLLGYGTINYSNSNGNSAGLSPTGQEIMNEDYNFGPIDNEGWALLLGGRYEFDVRSIGRDVYINAEYYRSNAGFFNLTSGPPYSASSYALYGSSYRLMTGVNISQYVALKIHHTWFNGDDVYIKTGGLSEYTNKPSPWYTKDFQVTVLQMNIEF